LAATNAFASGELKTATNNFGNTVAVSMTNAANQYSGRFLSITNASYGVITNNGLVWMSLITNNTPAWALPNGSICTTTNGQLFVMSNAVWVLK
jgi:hypothetical protein